METVLAKDVLRILLAEYVDRHLPDDAPGRYIRQMVAGLGASEPASATRPAVSPAASASSALPAKTVTMPRIEPNGTLVQSDYRALPKTPVEQTASTTGMTKGEKISAAHARRKAEREAAKQIGDDAVKNCMTSLLG